MNELRILKTWLVIMMLTNPSCQMAVDKNKPTQPGHVKVGEEKSAGMVTRIFHVDPDFQSGIPQVPGQTFEELLKLQGIPFPPGAKVITQGRASRQLIVRNTEANLALVEAYLQKANAQ